MNPTITIAAGALRGSVDGGVASFKGIPYAQPPCGPLRWRAPQPVIPWEGTRDATEFGPDCTQAPGDFETLRTTPSEDCLYLNVWKPQDATEHDALPVMVWIHGGGYVGGGTSSPVYDGSSFAADGIVVVTLNYRLGRFGFFAHPALTAAKEGPVGNFGYMDQIQALEWVRDNVAAFGGDPRRVTLVGQSAGGESALHLMTSPVVGDLFHRVIAMSGGGRRALLDRPMTDGSVGNASAAGMDKRFAVKRGVFGDGTDDLAKLRELAPATVAGRDNVGILGAKKLLGGSVAGVPIVDGDLVVGEPYEHFLSGAAKQIPIMIGSTAFDLPLHFPPSKIRPLKWFDDQQQAKAAYHDSAGRSPLDHVKTLVAVSTDMTMHEPAHFVASTMKKQGQPAWLYRFTYTAQCRRPDSLEQGHSGELPFLFQTLESTYPDQIADEDRATAAAFHAYVVNFVTHGDPNGTGLPAWPQIVPDEYDLMNFTLDDGPVFGPEPRAGVELVARAQERDLANAADGRRREG
ncbi:carboxylesterase/lipase family protein [Gordonia caeni]|uniref:Carboxylic ester hydrolase n=1 Tax=Gordonia caeni TaxID=1007097 RepID=A0ABP7NL87_9ACTN